MYIHKLGSDHWSDSAVYVGPGAYHIIGLYWRLGYWIE